MREPKTKSPSEKGLHGFDAFLRTANADLDQVTWGGNICSLIDRQLFPASRSEARSKPSNRGINFFQSFEHKVDHADVNITPLVLR